jgi:hypothetical protein
VAVTALARTPSSATGPIISSAVTSVPFAATTSRSAATVAWSVNGATRKQPAPTGAGTSWSWDWPLGTLGTNDPQGAVLDGSYLVGAKAFDANGVSGATRSVTVVLNRRQPYKPANFLGGRNGDSVEFEWAPNAERDIEGYRVYQEGGGLLGGQWTPVCALTRATSCRQTPAPSAPPLGVNYRLVAFDKDPNGLLRSGDWSDTHTVGPGSTGPAPPSAVSATTVDGAVTLNWTPSSGVAFYRIYRGGNSYEDRYDRVAAPQSTYTDPRTGGGTSKQYWVTAVNDQLGESKPVGPVSP